jgi:voltage-gated potassium channel
MSAAATEPHPRQDAFDRFSRIVDGPLMVLSVAMIPLLTIPLVVKLSKGTETAFLAADYVIWAVFAFEYFTKLYLAPNRRRFVRSNIPDLVIVVVPMLRPLRILRSARLLRLLRLTRVAAFAVEGISEIRDVMRRRGLNFVLLLVIAVVFLGALLVLEFERRARGGSIASYPDALWWAVTTVTTVGYGDKFPITAAGRGVAVVLMVAGIALFGVITATIAAYFVERDREGEPDKTEEQLESINARLAAIEAALVGGAQPRRRSTLRRNA